MRARSSAFGVVSLWIGVFLLAGCLVACGDDAPTEQDTPDGDADGAADLGVDTAALSDASDSSVPPPDLPLDQTPAPLCGDGHLDAGEVCDDGNPDNNDGCSSACQVEPGYACPTPNSPCAVPCGDGVVGPGEACDDADTTGGDGCSADCKAIEDGFACPVAGLDCEECGDGTVDAHEACDDSNRTDGDGCSAACDQIEAHYACPVAGAACEHCGDGTVDAHESCDDGNGASSDGCSSICVVEQGAVCPTPGVACVAERCGDGLVVAQERCDDGNRLSGDGCSFSCKRETGWVCPTPGSACRQTVCGDGIIEGDEVCDDGNAAPTVDGCDASCQLQAGYYCPTPGSACLPTTCGDGVPQGTEACDDGNTDAAVDGCSATCELDAGWACPYPGAPCLPTTCGDGVVAGTERCDDGNIDAGDGCAANCTIEALYACEGSPSVCDKAVEFVEVATFPVPTNANEAIHYDPITRTFTVYDFTAGDGIEFCTDGTIMGTRPRHGIGGRLDGATYDPFNDRFLFVQQTNILTEVDRSGQVVRQVTLGGTNMAAGISVGEDGRLYVADNTSGATVPKHVRVFDRWATTPSDTWVIWVNGPYLDQMVTIPSTGWVAMYNTPFTETIPHLRVYDYDGNLVGQSTIPGVMFASGDGAGIGLSDGAEAAVDGASFMLCSAYKTGNPDSPGGLGICVIFARTCDTHAECAARVPQTACKLDEPIPYCYTPGAARDDRYSVAAGSTDNPLDVGRNDLGSDQSCTTTPPTVVGVSTGDQGGTIVVAADGTSVEYTPAAGFCGQAERFTYDTDLGGASGVQTARVEVFVTCVCGDGTVGGDEACDDGDTIDGNGCNANCAVTPGWQCDTAEPSVCTPNN